MINFHNNAFVSSIQFHEFNPTNCSCVPGWRSFDGRGYNIFLLVLGFCIPFGIIVCASMAKYRELQKAVQLIQSLDIAQGSIKRNKRSFKMVTQFALLSPHWLILHYFPRFWYYMQLFFSVGHLTLCSLLPESLV